MAEAKKTASKTTQRSTSKTTTKRISVTVDKDFYMDLEAYTHENFTTIEDFVKKAIKEKLDRDRISTMIDFMSKR